jgi:aminoglycoside phosphotransferase (APT) family kinase protein
MRQYLKDACELIDACVFSGDVLESKEERAELKEYVERWLRAISQQEETEKQQDEQAAFEKWMEANKPSGDADEVQWKWEESDEYAAFHGFEGD